MAHLRDYAKDHPYPAQATIRLNDIWRDPEVATIQIRVDRVAELRDKFQPHLFGYPIISRRDDGVLVVLNGSHRCEALRSIFVGEDIEIDVALYEGLTLEQEKAIFERHHKKFLDAESRAAVAADTDESHIWTFDVDGTITSASNQYARLSHALRAVGDRCVVVTGTGPEQMRQELLDNLNFEYDSIVIVDPQEDGSGKAETLQRLGSWFHFDNEIAFGPEVIQICPIAIQYVEPAGDIKPKKAAKKAEKDLKRSLRDRFHGQSAFREVRSSDMYESPEDGDWA